MPEATVIHAKACRCTKKACARMAAHDSIAMVSCQYCLTLDPALGCPKMKKAK